MKQNKMVQRETKAILDDMNFEKVLTQKNELDNVNDLLVFCKKSSQQMDCWLSTLI